jgi:hypothetical protein
MSALRRKKIEKIDYRSRTHLNLVQLIINLRFLQHQSKVTKIYSVIKFNQHELSNIRSRLLWSLRAKSKFMYVITLFDYTNSLKPRKMNAKWRKPFLAQGILEIWHQPYLVENTNLYSNISKKTVTARFVDTPDTSLRYSG